MWDAATKYDVAEGAPNRTLLSVFLIMGQSKFRRLPITKLGKIYGIITVTDLMRAVVRLGLPEAYKAKITEFMTPDPIRIVLDRNLKDAIKLMHSKNIGSLLVVGKEEDRLQGILTERDILKNLNEEKELSNVKLSSIKEYLKVDFLTCNEGALILNLMKEISEKHVTRVITLNEEGNVSGLISANDITSLVAKEREEIKNNPNFLTTIPAKFLSTKNVLSVEASSNLLEAISYLNSNSIGGAPVLENGKLLGVISERTVVKYLGDQL